MFGKAGDTRARARAEAWVVLGVLGFGCLFPILIISETDWSRLAKLAATAPLSALQLFCIVRWPNRSGLGQDKRPMFRRRRGSHFPDRLPDGLYEGLESPTFEAGIFGVQPGRVRVWTGLAAGGALISGAVAGNVDRWGAMTTTGFFGYLLFGGLMAVAARGAVRLLAGGRALRVEPGRIVLGPALGYIPAVALPTNGVRASIELDGEIVLLSGASRVDIVPLKHVTDKPGLRRALSATKADAELRREARIRRRASQQGGIVERFRKTPGGRDPVDVETLSDADGPAERDLVGARRQWAIRLVAMSLGAVVSVGVFGASVVWYIDQRQANDALLEHGEVVAAEVVRGSRRTRGPDEIDVRFEVGGAQYERTIHSGWFSGVSHGLRGETIPVLFDEEAPGTVRLVERRNIHSMTHVGTLAGFFLALAMPAIAQDTWRANRLLRSTTWRRGEARLWKRRHGTGVDLYRPSGSKVDFGHASGVRSREGTLDVWYSSGRKQHLLVPDGGRSAFTVNRRRPLKGRRKKKS